MVHNPELLKCIFVKNYDDFPNRRVSKMLGVMYGSSMYADGANVKCEYVY